MALEINDLVNDLDREAQAKVFGGKQAKSGDSKSGTKSGSDDDTQSGGIVIAADIMGTAACVPEMDDSLGW